MGMNREQSDDMIDVLRNTHFPLLPPRPLPLSMRESHPEVRRRIEALEYAEAPFIRKLLGDFSLLSFRVFNVRLLVSTPCSKLDLLDMLCKLDLWGCLTEPTGRQLLLANNNFCLDASLPPPIVVELERINNIVTSRRLRSQTASFYPFGNTRYPTPKLQKPNKSLESFCPVPKGNITHCIRYFGKFGTFHVTAHTSYDVAKTLTRIFLRKVQKKFPDVKRIRLQLKSYSFSFQAAGEPFMFHRDIWQNLTSGKTSFPYKIVMCSAGHFNHDDGEKFKSQFFQFEMKYGLKTETVTNVRVRVYNTRKIVCTVTSDVLIDTDHEFMNRVVLDIMTALPSISPLLLWL